jgi:hypothetical protein
MCGALRHGLTAGVEQQGETRETAREFTALPTTGSNKPAQTTCEFKAMPTARVTCAAGCARPQFWCAILDGGRKGSNESHSHGSTRLYFLLRPNLEPAVRDLDSSSPTCAVTYVTAVQQRLSNRGETGETARGWPRQLASSRRCQLQAWREPQGVQERGKSTGQACNSGHGAYYSQVHRKQGYAQQRESYAWFSGRLLRQSTSFPL